MRSISQFSNSIQRSNNILYYESFSQTKILACLSIYIKLGCFSAIFYLPIRSFIDIKNDFFRTFLVTTMAKADTSKSQYQRGGSLKSFEQGKPLNVQSSFPPSQLNFVLTSVSTTYIQHTFLQLYLHLNKFI
jgi:hypothetical protein